MVAVDLHHDLVAKELLRRAHAARAEAADIHIPVAAFVTPDFHILITKTGDLCAFYETEGIDPVCLSEQEIKDHAKILTEAMNESDGRLSVHQYWIKDRAFVDPDVKPYRDPLVVAVDAARGGELAKQEFFSTRLVYCLEWKSSFSGGQSKYAAILPLVGKVLKGLGNKAARTEAIEHIQEVLGGERATLVVESRLLDEVADFRGAMDAMITRFERLTLGGDLDASLAEAIGATRLEFTRLVGTEAFRVLHRLWNWTPETRHNLVYPGHPDRINHWIAQDNLDLRDPSVLWSGEVALRLYSVRGFRDPVAYDVLHHVREIPCEMIIHTRFARMGTDESSSFVAGKINQAHNWGGFVKGDPMRPKRIQDMKLALAESVRGKPFGQWACQIALSGDTRNEVMELSKRFETVAASAGITYRTEEMSKDYAFYSMLPGNSINEYCVRTVQTSTAVAVLMPYRQAEGRGVLPPRDCPFPEALCSINTYNPETKKPGMPVNWFLSVGNIGHFAVLGKSGGGKSFLVNYLVTNWGRYAGTVDEPVGLKRWIVDKGHSYRSLCTLMNGAYVNVADPATIAKMNPFDLPPDQIRANTPMLVALLGLMMATASTARVDMTEKEAGTLALALEGMARQLQDSYQEGGVGSLERLAGFLQGDQTLLKRLAAWLPDGEYGHIFPAEVDGMEGNDFTVLNFEAQYVPDSILGAVFFYILSRISSAVESDKLSDWRKLMFIDEAAAFITPQIGDWKSEMVTAQIRNFIRIAWKTWRKKNGVLALATQEASDLAIDDVFWSTFKGGVPTKIFLTQKSTGDELTHPKKGLGIPSHLVDEIQKLPLGAFLVDAGGMRRYLQVKPDATSYSIFTTDPNEGSFRSWWLSTHPYSIDYPPYAAFEDIGKHIRAAKRSGNPQQYYAARRNEGG